MESRIIIEYVVPGGSTKDADKLAEFMDPDMKMPIPAENQIVTLPVEHPIEGFAKGEQQKDFRVVQVRYSFAGFAPNISHQIVHILVTDLGE